jgi:hypothetical protein
MHADASKTPRRRQLNFELGDLEERRGAPGRRLLEGGTAKGHHGAIYTEARGRHIFRSIAAAGPGRAIKGKRRLKKLGRAHAAPSWVAMAREEFLWQSCD